MFAREEHIYFLCLQVLQGVLKAAGCTTSLHTCMIKKDVECCVHECVCVCVGMFSSITVFAILEAHV